MRHAALILIVACHTGPSPTAPGAGTAPGTSTSTPASTPPVATGPWEELEPSARIVGLPLMDLGFHLALVPAHGGDEGLILASVTHEEPSLAELALPRTLFLPGVLSPGEHPVLDVWDGVSGYSDTADPDWSHVAGDVDDDGHLDLWIDDALFLGPLEGRALGYREGHAAVIEGDGPVVAADFDADGDGHEDVLLHYDGHAAALHYGPFAGVLPGAFDGGADPATSSLFGEGSSAGSRHGGLLLRDHLGAGQHAVALSVMMDTGSDETVIYDLMQARGARVTEGEALWRTPSGWGYQQNLLEDPGDLDGDEMGDVLLVDGQWSTTLQGPLQGLVDYVTATPAIEHLPATSSVQRAVGDLDGDGVQELLGLYSEGSFEDAWLVLMFSPHDEVLDLSTGLPITQGTTLRDVLAGHADLDGDGLPDLVRREWVHDTLENEPELAEAGEILIWYGADLLAAEEARQAR